MSILRNPHYTPELGYSSAAQGVPSYDTQLHANDEREIKAPERRFSLDALPPVVQWDDGIPDRRRAFEAQRNRLLAFGSAGIGVLGIAAMVLLHNI